MILSISIKLILWTTISTLISLAPELFLDKRHVNKKTDQDKIGQFPWRVVCVGNGILWANLLIIGTPKWTIDTLWQFWALTGQTLFSIGLYWVLIDTIMALYLKQKWYYVGTTSEIDKEFKSSHLFYKLIFLALGTLLMITYATVNYN